MKGLDYGSQLVLDLCGGEPTKAVCGEIPQPDFEIAYPVSEAERLTELRFLHRNQPISSLASVSASAAVAAAASTVPFRSKCPEVDLMFTARADLVEEIMRIRGINNIEPQPLPSLGAVGKKILTTGQTRTRNTRRALAARGMSEAVCYSFIPKSHAEAFGGGAPELALSNPIASDMSDMRPSLLPACWRLPSETPTVVLGTCPV